MPEEVLGAFIVLVFLVMHFYASHRGWYQTRPNIDMITHFLGGLAFGFFWKDFLTGIVLIFTWEIVEIALIKENRAIFRESPDNKVRDIIIGGIGYWIGFAFL